MAIWKSRLSADARRDLREIVQWTRRRFGRQQARRYGSLIGRTLCELAGGPFVPGTVGRDDLGSGIRALHVARKGARGRHFVVYRVVGTNTIEIVRILHDSMDLARHVPDIAPDGDASSEDPNRC